MKHYFFEVVAVRRGVVCWVGFKLRYLISKKMQQDPWERKLSPGPVFAQTIAHHTQSKGQKFDGPLPLSPPSKNDGSFVRQRELGMQLVNQD